MRIIQAVLILLLAMPAVAHAIPVFDVESVACTGNLATELADAVSLDCSGDLTLVGGAIEADTAVRISSFGALRLDDLSISAPAISLLAGHALTVGAESTLDAAAGGTISLSAGLLDIAPGAVISLGGVVAADGRFDAGLVLPAPGGRLTVGNPVVLTPAVPEADTPILLLAGLLALGLTRRATAPARA